MGNKAKSPFFQLGAAVRRYVDESARLQDLNLGIWRVSGEIAGRRIGRTCHNWAGARLAMSLLEKRGARFVQYERQRQG